MNTEYSGGFESSNQKEGRQFKLGMSVACGIICIFSAISLWLSGANAYLILGLFFWSWGNNIWLKHLSK